MHIITTLLALHMAATPAATLPSHAVRAVSEDSSKMTLVVVQNNRGVPVTVYAENGQQDIKLGVVDADGITTFQLSDWFVAHSNVQIFVTPRGQAQEDTGYLVLSPGNELAVIVPRR